VSSKPEFGLNRLGLGKRPKVAVPAFPYELVPINPYRFANTDQLMPSNEHTIQITTHKTEIFRKKMSFWLF
jgi:hypothetical protein